MKKLNNKGMTLIELIVSFVLVSVAVIYFYQTLTTVYKLYNDTRKETREYVDWNYAFRVANEMANQSVCTSAEKKISGSEDEDTNYFTCKKASNYYVIKYTKDGTQKYLFNYK